MRRILFVIGMLLAAGSTGCSGTEGFRAAPDLVLASPKEEKDNTAPLVEAEDGSRIDVLFVYTPKALTATGGLSGLEAKAYANEAFLNIALRESLPNVRPAPQVNIVGFAEIPASTPVHTRRLARDSAVRMLRTKFKADLIVAIHDRYKGGAGTAYPFCDNPEWHSQNAYAAVIRPRSMMYFMTPAHEMGHLLGGGHDYDHRGLECLYEDSRGWSFEAVNASGKKVLYGTLMDYNGDVRIPRFSNPNVSYFGVPTGQAGKADNARAVNDARRVIANYIAAAEPVSAAPGGPVITIAAPQDNHVHAPKAWMTITATAADPDAVSEVQLLWDNGSAFGCPVTGLAELSCTQSGQTFTWRILADEGERSFRIRALDARGNRTITPRRTVFVR
jgi:hypothetical protein